ncbi:MAG: hypothetical protein MUC91_04485, partial [Verrucomicrobia bacterium]|nr:hypothetical protein [Verrucomicrobiota bacterium]
KPLLRRDGDDVYICNWTNITSFTRDDENRGTLDLDIKAQRDLIPVLPPNPVQGSEFNAYNVPWVIGAKKGLPNFNEMSLQSVFEITRKLQIDKRLRSTNQLLFVGVSNAVAVEAWNSYTNWFPLGVNIVARNDMEVGLAISNRFQSSVNGMFGSSRVYATAATNLIQAWEGRGAVNNPNRVAFQVPIYTNFASFVPAVFTKNGLMQTNLNRGWLDAASGGGGDLPVPVIRLYVTNRLQFYMLARNDAGVTNVIDYVHLRVVSERDISRELDEEGSNTERDLWDSNRAANAGDIPRGVLRQILVSLGTPGVPDFVWDNYGRLEAAGARTKEQAIANFMAFYYGRDATFRGYQGKFSSTNLVMQVPFSPTRRLLEYRTWQANDPLVHYMAGDLEYLEQGDGIRNLSPLERIPSLENENLRRLNDRYQPWGGNPSSAATRGGTTARNFKLELKDPGVRFSDDWEFPTNKFPNVGWLGRVHRGTPWQTIYMKANEIGQGRGGGSGREWREWTGNSSRRDAALTFPQQDFKLFDLFTAALSDNATAGQMSVNQDGLAAWSAILSGVIALTNTAPGESTPRIITPAGVDQPNSAVGRIVEGINSDRNREPKKAFERVGDVLKAEELSVRSPFLNLSDVQAQQAMTDALYERIPQQIMGSLRGSDKPRFVVYSYGQRLKPAERSLVTSGPLFGLCTNYQVTAEVAVRSVIQVDGAPNRPQVSVESFNLLPAD